MKVIDVGCGPGIYVDSLRDQGIDAVGVDIDPACPYDVCDVFSQEYLDKYTSKKYLFDLCLCLEVAEHLNESLSQEFIKRLTLTAPYIIFSAAQPGQGGHGHINCQTKQYWIEKFNNCNFVVASDETDQLLNFITKGVHMGWLANNVIVFQSYSKAYYDVIIETEKPQADRLASYIKEKFS